MRILVVAIAMLALTVPAFSQNQNQGFGAAGKPAGRDPPPLVDVEKKKKDEKAFNEGVGRIPPSEKKYDPWGAVRSGGGNR